MIELVEQKKTALIALCRQYGVKKLDLFGSAASGTFVSGESDLDFVIEFLDSGPGISDRFFGFVDATEQLFGLSVDFVFESGMSNPYLRYSVNASRESIYDANANRQTAA